MAYSQRNEKFEKRDKEGMRGESSIMQERCERTDRGKIKSGTKWGGGLDFELRKKSWEGRRGGSPGIKQNLE